MDSDLLPYSLREAVAYHEAGHAVVTWYFHRDLATVTIVPVPHTGNLGHFLSMVDLTPYVLDDLERRIEIEHEIMILVAGEIAEAFVTGERRWPSAFEDYIQVDAQLRLLTDDEEEIGAYLRWLEIRTENLIRNRHLRPVIEAVAEGLLKKDTLSPEELNDVCGRVHYQSKPAEEKCESAGIVGRNRG